MHGSPSPSSARGTPARRGRPPRSAQPSPSLNARSATLTSEPLINKAAASFTSSLSIRVEGTVPVAKRDEPTPSAAAVDSRQPAPPVSEAKRAPRKSKTDALAALQNHLDSPSSAQDDPFAMHDDEFAYTTYYSHVGPPISVSPDLDVASVKTASPRVLPDTGKQRPFGLKDCPVFYPSPEEFKDPMAYIRSISPTAQNFGICKIVPPIGWKMPFVTETETFRFKTRVQRLNSIEASSRAKLNFLEQLYRFHAQQGNSRVFVPTINHKPLDLWLLRKEVHKLGGYETVSRTKKWADLGRLLGYGGIPGLSTQIRNSYTRVVLPYEHFCDRVRNSGFSPATPRHDPGLKTHSNFQSASAFKDSSATPDPSGGQSPPSSPLTNSSSPLSEPPDDADLRDGNESKFDSIKPRRSTRHGSQDQPTPSTSKLTNGGTLIPSAVLIPLPALKGEEETRTPPSEQTCEVCHKKNRETEMLLCDGCDCGFHTFCLEPPLNVIPKGQWFCHTCLFGTGGDFGFDEGEEHSLSTFQARDLEFRRMWWKSHPPTQSPDINPESDPTVNQIAGVNVSEYDVENEFWRLVQSPNETVEIEYGADVHSTTHGSAMPTLETHPLDPYSRDPWNLNNMPIVSDSLLRFIKSDISGMTVPWTYVGMTFSTFCWHNEDHYTYSVNFMHWGETKTWYGIPGDDADKFEAAIRREAPDLFEAQPDLLFQLVTLMNPQRLTEAGVRVYACNQRAGEFVITFPKAYHAGFNHGLNFNEAVNFAPPDWLSYGRACVKRYQEHRKLPVFSHDELVITITQQSQTTKTALWLTESLTEMVNRELDRRKRVRTLESGVNENLSAWDRPEDQYQCMICKVFCYLSQVTCPCATKVVCLDHAEYLACACLRSEPILRLRFSDRELLDTQKEVADRAAVTTTWRAKLHKLLSESARPPLRSLRALLAEGDRISYRLPELNALRKCVLRASDWVDAANVFITRKQTRRQVGRGSKSVHPLPNGDETSLKPERGLDDLYQLLREVEDLGFDTPEIVQLKELADQTESIRTQAQTLRDADSSRKDRVQYLQECDALIARASSINIRLDEALEIRNIVKRDELLRELGAVDDSSVTLEQVREYLAVARSCNLPPDGEYVRLLEEKEHAGRDWDERAKDFLAGSSKTIEELEEFVDVNSNIPIDPTIYDRLLAALTKAKDHERQAKAWLYPEQLNAPKPRVQDALRLVSRAEKEFSISAIQDLKRTADFALALEARCEAVLKNDYEPEEQEGPVFDTIRGWKSYAQEHLTMFSLPLFAKLDHQLALHQAFLDRLPWACPQHGPAHGKQIAEDVMESTRPDDDLPPDDEYFTCICTTPVRPPPPGVVSDAVQCDHCFARFHGICAAKGGSCPFCDHRHWNGTIHKERSWHFCYLPNILNSAPEISKNYSEAYKDLDVIVRDVTRLSTLISQFLAFAAQPGNQRPEYIPQVRHYMRKLYKIQFAISPNPEVSFGLDLAGLHRILAGQPAPVRMKKRRRPRFVFGQDQDKDWRDGTRCICRGHTPFLYNYPIVQCEYCSKKFHATCVFYPSDPASLAKGFFCPLCCVRKNRPYQYCDIRVRHYATEDRDTFVDTKEMLETFSKEIIYKKLPPPFKPTVFIELLKFTPGQPDNVAAISSGTRIGGSPNSHAPSINGSGHHHALTVPSTTPLSSASVSTSYESKRSGGRNIPPPPWSNGWNSTSSAPPHASRRSSMELPPVLPARTRKHSESDTRATPEADGVGTSHPVTPQRVARSASDLSPVVLPRKRKYPDDNMPQTPEAPGAVRSAVSSPKRRTPLPQGINSSQQRVARLDNEGYHVPSSSNQSIPGPSTVRRAPTSPRSSPSPQPVRRVKLLVRDSSQKAKDWWDAPSSTVPPSAV